MAKKNKDKSKGKKRDGAKHWYAVRCVFRTGWWPREDQRPPKGWSDYEERITLWYAPSFKVAIKRAEKEARRYAATIGASPDRYLGFAQAYWMVDEPGDGAEVFSLIRRSPLKPSQYLAELFETGVDQPSEARLAKA